MNGSPDTMHIVVCIDDAYAQHGAVLAASIAANLAPGRRGLLHVLHEALSEDNKERLRRTVAATMMDVTFYAVEGNAFKGLRTESYLSAATYYKIIIPSVLSEDIEKALYLDSDMVVNGDLSGLYDMDVPYLGAVPDTNSTMWQYYDCLFRTMRHGTYFNAGLLLMNLRRMRSIGASRKMLGYIAAYGHRFHWHDQTGFNWMFHGLFTVLHPKYNLLQCLAVERPQLQNVYTSTDYAQALAAPVVVHYAGGAYKPWELHSAGRFRGLYWKYIALTPFADAQPVVSTTNALHRAMRQLLVRFTPLLLLKLVRVAESALFMRAWGPMARRIDAPSPEIIQA